MDDDKVSGVKRTRRADDQDEEEQADHISRLPDALLGEIVSLLPTKDGGRTQILSPRWRHVWRSAPLNIDLHDGDGRRRPMERRIHPTQIAGILSSHGGPGRRFAIPMYHVGGPDAAATIDAWLRSPALDGLQELEFHYASWWMTLNPPPLPPPESARRFSSTLRVATIGYCAFPDGDGDGDGLRLPLLEQLSLMHVKISETSLYALLDGCPLLQSLMLARCAGCSRLRIASQTLRSIGTHASWGESGTTMLDPLIIEDAPLLERWLLLDLWIPSKMVISVISAPRLKVLGQLHIHPEFRNSVLFKGPNIIDATTVLPSVTVLALKQSNLSLELVIAFIKCFPCLENLYIKIPKYSITKTSVSNVWRQKYRKLIGTLDIRLKQIVLKNYKGNKAHVNFAQFFVLNARVLESMVLEIPHSNNNPWIERQQTLLQIEDRASRGARFDFVYHSFRPGSSEHLWYEQVHDLSTADPFVGFDYWATDD